MMSKSSILLKQKMDALLIPPSCLVFAPTLNSVVVCTDLSGNNRHKQVGMSRVVTSGCLDGVIVSTLCWNASDDGLIPTLGAIFLNFLTPVTLVLMTRICESKQCGIWLLNLPCVCKVTTIGSTKRLTISRWWVLTSQARSCINR